MHLSYSTPVTHSFLNPILPRLVKHNNFSRADLIKITKLNNIKLASEVLHYVGGEFEH